MNQNGNVVRENEVLVPRHFEFVKGSCAIKSTHFSVALRKYQVCNDKRRELKINDHCLGNFCYSIKQEKISISSEVLCAKKIY